MFNFLINGGRYESEEHVHKHDSHPDHLTVCNIRANCLSPNNLLLKNATVQMMDKPKKDEVVEASANTPVIVEDPEEQKAVQPKQKVTAWRTSLEVDTIAPAERSEEPHGAAFSNTQKRGIKSN
ncbi:unnamed protein product [Gongylonema pulchrum]|uniref:HNHc domain-containing protein n=1 Tax=Gongylonema pulchrum TaxID=637853 RepID=A0A183ET62_9BILA|nr:unnamed protein product [Gongylonema pulchrum]